MIQILIIDDHPLVAGGIELMLKDEISYSMAGSVKNAKDAIRFLENNQPDIVLLDISLPDMDGLELCSVIRKQNRQIKIIGLTSTNEAGIITQLLSNGGNGYLLKNMERVELLTALDEVMKENIYLSRDANQKILEQFQSVKNAIKSIPVLTRREKEILKWLYEGLNGPQIAEKLFLSPYTVETHRKNLMQKLNVNTTQQLIKVSLEQKLI